MHEQLIERRGYGGANCVNPWTSDGCASDPALMGSFFRQCRGGGTPGAKTAVLRQQLSHHEGGCRGAVLAPREGTATLRHNAPNKSKSRGRLCGVAGYCAERDRFVATQQILALRQLWANRSSRCSAMYSAGY